ncbi:hypothetical protein JCM33374_g5972 [Metschnikowia sp. JCM 33374]|nr:hypothetical protein JCM33374_g5972 [Metschnikowia sp. JCM 33374]
MADINSLINPPEETKVTIVPKREAPSRKRVAVKDEDEDYKDEDEYKEENGDTNENGASGEPIVSQDTILSSFDRIKTHFPAARIKKIMQSDEDIGKVAQATPVVVGRALEIFMANLVEAAIIETKGAGVRRIAASHVRAAVEKTEQFDFLVDIVSKYSSTKN